MKRDKSGKADMDFVLRTRSWLEVTKEPGLDFPVEQLKTLLIPHGVRRTRQMNTPHSSMSLLNKLCPSVRVEFHFSSYLQKRTRIALDRTTCAGNKVKVTA